MDDRGRALVDVIVVNLVKVAIVQVVDVAGVPEQQGGQPKPS